MAICDILWFAKGKRETSGWYPGSINVVSRNPN